jgi:hypothetical protein
MATTTKRRTATRRTAKTAAKPRRAAPKPEAPIRRFDIFAEYNRQKARRDGMPAAQAKGHGLWIAKVVAARKFRGPQAETDGHDRGDERKRPAGKWKTLSGEAQTDKLFDKEIVRRMGAGFYRRVFVPAIEAALEAGRSYESIRDTLRKDWKPGT